MWRENKPGFIILSILLLAMFWSIGYFIYSRTTGRFVVTVEKISREQGFDLNVRNVLKVYCREFSRECAETGKDQVAANIRLVLARILMPGKAKDAKITYTNNSRHLIEVTRFLARTAPVPWRVNETHNRFAPKMQRLAFAIQKATRDVPFEIKVDFADTVALIENTAPFALLPGEQKTWRVGYTDSSEFQLEYTQDGKLYRTPVLRPR